MAKNPNKLKAHSLKTTNRKSRSTAPNPKERKGKERKGKERKGKERKGRKRGDQSNLTWHVEGLGHGLQVACLCACFALINQCIDSLANLTEVRSLVWISIPTLSCSSYQHRHESIQKKWWVKRELVEKKTNKALWTTLQPVCDRSEALGFEWLIEWERTMTRRELKRHRSGRQRDNTIQGGR